MKYLAIIPARGDSKGILKKNIKLLNGKPLIYYTIEAAKAVFPAEDICISTDSEEIMAVAEDSGLQVPFRRPDLLATDHVGLYETLLHAVAHYEKSGRNYDAIVVLQPTSPLRTGRHIREAVSKFRPDIDMVVSVKETKSNPYYLLFEEDENGFLKKSKKGSFTRRQDCPKVWEYNGAIYVINLKSLKQSRSADFTKVEKYVMDEMESVDIDTPLDFLVAEYHLKAKESADASKTAAREL